MLCQYFVRSALATSNIPEQISWDETATIQPLAVAVHLGRQAGSQTGQTKSDLTSLIKDSFR